MGLKPADTTLEVEPVLPFSDLKGHCGAMGNALRAFTLAYLAIYYVHGGDDWRGYAAYGKAKTFEWEWMWPYLVRNLIGTFVICFVWDWILYFSPLAPIFKPYKIVDEYPSIKQLKHDGFWTTSATFTATFVEWGLCYLYANGILSFDYNLGDSPLKSLFWALFLTHVREPHFYTIHRLMHPWRNPYLPDIGKFLYRHVHSLHHKSYNTTSMSGTSMHPVESTLYYMACVMAIPFGCHPAIPLGIMIDCGIAAWLGHSGFVFPATGDVYHQIHHLTFDCNYGTPNIPVDAFFGTFSATQEDVKYIWQKSSQKVGKAGNETAVHQSSSSSKKV